jgi:hypothetical protein
MGGSPVIDTIRALGPLLLNTLGTGPGLQAFLVEHRDRVQGLSGGLNLEVRPGGILNRLKAHH